MSSVSSSENPSYRVRRKPPPAIRHAEKYPAPDPGDPFAPLWVLRNRTSSALGQNPLVTEASPSPFSPPPVAHASRNPFGAHGKKSPSNSIPMERRRSNSLHPHSNIPPVNPFQALRSTSIIPSSSTELGSQHGFINRPPSQASFSRVVAHTQNVQSTRSDVIPNPQVGRTQNEPGPSLAHPDPGKVMRPPTVDRQTPDHSSSAETESEGPGIFTSAQQQPLEPVGVEHQGKKSSGMTATLSFNIGIDVKPKLLRRATSSGTSNSVAVSFSGKDSRPAAAPQQQQQQSRLAKLLLSKKTSHDGYMADGEKKSSRGHARTAVQKASISAPLVDTFVHRQGEPKLPDPRQTQVRSPARSASRGTGDYTSDTDAEESTNSSRFRATKALFRGPAPKKTGIHARAAYTGGAKTGLKEPETAEVVVSSRSAEKVVEKPKSRPQDDDNGHKHRTEMSWAEVNLEDYYTPAASPRVSYPTPAPSPELKHAQELEPESPNETKVGRDKKPKRGTTTVASSVPRHDPPAVPKVEEQATKARNLKSTKPHTTTPPPSIPISPSAPAIPCSSMPAPPPPPKISKRRTSSSRPPVTHTTEAGYQTLPSTQSVSNTSIVHVSLISSPTPTPLSEHEEDARAYVKPRRAPKPPGGMLTEDLQYEPELVLKEVQVPKWEEGERERNESSQKSTMGPSKATLEDVTGQQQKEEKTAAKTTIKSGSKLPVSILMQGRAPPVDFGLGKGGDIASTGNRTGEAEGTSTSKKLMTASVSGPVSFPSRGKERALSPLPSSQPPRLTQGPKAEQALDQLSHPSENAILAPSQLSYIALLPLYAEDGRKLFFRNIFEKQKTVVIFVRHLWCPNCQNYMTSVRDIVHPEMLIDSGGIGGAERGVAKGEMQEKISVVVITSLPHGMISKYRQTLSLPFKVYSDPTLALYKAIGIGKTDRDCQSDLTDKQQPDQSAKANYYSDSATPAIPKKKILNYSLRRKAGAETSMSSLSEREQGSGSVKHGLMSGFAMVVVRAIKVGMREKADSEQLGGEFVFGPGLACSYAHRMQPTRGHASIEVALQAAGVQLIREPSRPDRPSSPPPVPAIPKTFGHKHAQSVDLASPPKSRDNRPPAEEVAQTAVRTRRESLKPSVNLSRPNANQAPLPLRDPSLQGNRERRNTDASSALPIPISSSSKRILQMPPTLPSSIKAVMTREEEEAWWAERQRAIEKIQEKKDVRRVGELGRTPNSQGASSQTSSQGYVQAASAASTNRIEKLLTESKSAPIKTLGEGDRTLYKVESRRPQERTRQDGHGNVQRISTVRVGHSANARRYQ